MRTPQELNRLQEQAVILRREGKSRRQIKQILGPMSNSTLNEALRDEPPPEWTRRPKAKDGLRSKARELRAQGVTTVVNLRSPPEMNRVPFDEAALVKQLGMEYVYLPMRGTPELPYSPAAVKSFAAAMSGAKGKVLLHCTIAWRASHLWAAYLIQNRDVPVATALEQARMINLMDDMRMDGDRQPVEAFLGRALAEVGHGKR